MNKLYTKEEYLINKKTLLQKIYDLEMEQCLVDSEDIKNIISKLPVIIYINNKEEDNND